LADAGLTVGTVVDLGCGSGIFAAILSEAGYDVRGVDPAPAMVDLARTHAPRATIELGSVHDFELPRAVAIVALGEVLNYATDSRAGLDARARRVGSGRYLRIRRRHSGPGRSDRRGGTRPRGR
jgi:2-polyprenyl-3-methyl-5-hydroxy-6-metoxy-1,4-benzoquinol methylase